MRADDLLDQIKLKLDLDSMRSLRLVHSRRAAYYHYAVALSDTVQISWYPNIENYAQCIGVFRMGNLSADFEDARWVKYQRRNAILASLFGSVEAFHLNWDYGLIGWNCEHWSRLITTGFPVSYQCKEKVFGASAMIGGCFSNPDAIHRLRMFLT